jgi:prepilin-type processing-associated H-X9-DG protein
MEYADLYHEINVQPHGGASNERAETDFLDIYYCPSGQPHLAAAGSLFVSNYAAVAGGGTNLANGAANNYLDLEDTVCGDVLTNGIFYPCSRTRIAEITDGTSRTLAVGERTYFALQEGSWLSGATWRNLPGAPNAGPDVCRRTLMEDLPPDASICSTPAKNIRWPLNVDHSQLGYYAKDTRVGPDQRNPELLLNDLPFASDHPGGVQFTMADGSVQFINDAIDVTLLFDMATKSGGETR